MIRALYKDISNKWKFNNKADRIGLDMPFTHWKLQFTTTMKSLCYSRFKFFHESASFRPGAYAICCSNISLGKNVVIRPNTMLFADDFAEIVIGDDVMIGSGVHFYVNNHRFDNIEQPIITQGYYPSESIEIKEGAWIGANSIILPGVTVGKNTVIGAGSVVTKSVADFSVAVGNPARVIKTMGS